jgi:LPS-assembly protein
MVLRHFQKISFLILSLGFIFLSRGALAQSLTGFENDEPTPSPILTAFSEEQGTEQPPSDISPEISKDLPAPVQASMQAEEVSKLSVTDEPVNLDAEKLVHDEATGTITASGNVFLVQGGRILRADEIVYSLKNDTVVASGHVVLNEENGDIHYADKVKFNDKLKNGFVQGLKVYLADGSRFTATQGRRKDGNRTTMDDASYTPCEDCKAHPEKPPLWAIRASKVIHDEEKKNITYKDARFEVKGVPIMYAPYFSHPDGTVKRKSGFLAPSAGYKSDRGAFVTNHYYWNIAPDKDATLGMMAMAKESPMFMGEWRQRWNSAHLEASGGIVNSGRTENVGGVNVTEDDELRGHILANGLWDINDKWRAGTNVAWASDDQYMRQYDFTDEDVLEREVYAERFSGRNYAVARLLTFQDVRVEERQEDQPEVLPEMTASFIGEPGSMPVVGGRWSLDGSFLGLRRNGSDQDMNRLDLKAGWKRRFVSDYGLVTTADASVRGDLYSTRDRTIATPGSGVEDSANAVRVFPQVHFQSSYPMAKPLQDAQVTIEPIVALTMAPNIDIDDDIPNEDSQDVQIDTGNIFDPDRFPGVDRLEDQSRVTYGIRTGIYGFDGSYGDVFLGQSHRFNEDDNPFPSGSGLDRQNSDIVGQISGAAGEHYALNYRFQVASDTLASVRHEVDATGDWGKFSLSSRYLFADSLEGTDIEDGREQLQGSAGYYLNEDWQLRAGATQDLGETPGLRKAYAGINYFGQCMSWSLIGKRNYTDDASGESDNEILFKIGLKNLGGYERSGLRDYRAED